VSWALTIKIEFIIGNNMKINLLLTLAIVGALTGCASFTSNMKASVMERASFDLDCPKHSISIVDIGTRTFGAKGCNKKASYVLRGECSFQHNCQAVMNSSDGNNK
jgi:hypothetical protein